MSNPESFAANKEQGFPLNESVDNSVGLVQGALDKLESKLLNSERFLSVMNKINTVLLAATPTAIAGGMAYDTYERINDPQNHSMYPTEATIALTLAAALTTLGLFLTGDKIADKIRDKISTLQGKIKEKMALLTAQTQESTQ